MSTELAGFYPFELKIIQLDFEHVEKHLALGRAGAAFRCWLAVDSLVRGGCCPKRVTVMLLLLQTFTYP